MSKSHFFVQNGSGFIKEGYKQCPYCGVLFKPIHGNQKYCCHEHYKENVKKLKKEWKDRNKDRLNARRREKYNETKEDNVKTSTLRIKARKKRNKIIKAELVNLTLMTFQCKYARFDLRFNWRRDGCSKWANYPRDKIIKAQLHDKGLYSVEIEESKKYPLDFSELKRRGKVKIPDDIVIPDVPLKEPEIRTMYDYITSDKYCYPYNLHLREKK